MGWHKDDKDKIDRKIWAAVRVQVLDRDSWKCVLCGRKGRLECDHKIPMHHAGPKYDMANLQTLCRQCHFDKTELERKVDQESPEAKEWREYMADSV